MSQVPTKPVKPGRKSFSTTSYVKLNGATVAGNPASLLEAYQKLCKRESGSPKAASTKKDERSSSIKPVPKGRISLRKQQKLRLTALRASKVAAPSAAELHDALAVKYGQEGSLMLEADAKRRAKYVPRRLQVRHVVVTIIMSWSCRSSSSPSETLWINQTC